MDGTVSLGVSPGFQELSLKPGEKYSGIITVVNSSLDPESIVDFLVSVAPFSVTGEEYSISYNEENDFNQIAKWISIEKPSGFVRSQELVEVPFSIDVPSDALGSGQYAALIVRAAPEENTAEGNKIGFNRQVASILYATVDGKTKVEGAIIENRIPGFFFSPPITASSLVENSGNIHFDAEYTLKIFPLFSEEEIYSMEESPKTNIVVPGTTLLSSNEWGDTPRLGIFRVVQTVSAAGNTSTVEKTVFVCPLWFLSLWILFTFGGIFWLFANSRARKKAAKRAKTYEIPRISR